MVADGAMIHYKDEHDWKDLENEIMKLFMGAIIPEAWKHAPDLKPDDQNKYSAPFFL